MPQPTPRRWQSWRVTRLPAPARFANTPDALALRMNPTPPHRLAPVTDVPALLHAEAPGPDGIRHGLVEHVRRLIADGVYDTPERWAAAEERLLDRAASR